MKRGLMMCGCVILVCAAKAPAGTVVFSPLGPTSVLAGTNIDFSVSLQAAGVFDLTNVLIGSSTVTDVGFVTDPAWDLAFQPPGSSSLEFDYAFAPPGFSQNVFVDADRIGNGTTGPNLDVGTLTLITTGMAPGMYSVTVSSDDSYTFNTGEGGNEDVLTSEGLVFVIIPEPSTLALLALSATLLRRRR